MAKGITIGETTLLLGPQDDVRLPIGTIVGIADPTSVATMILVDVYVDGNLRSGQMPKALLVAVADDAKISNVCRSCKTLWQVGRPKCATCN